MHTRHLYITLLVVATALIGCRDNTHFRLSGSFEHLRQAEFYIYSPDGGSERHDTIHVVGGEFEWETPLNREATFYVVFPNLSEQIIFAAPGDVVKMKGDAEQLRATRVEGTPDNEAYTRLRLDNLKATPQQRTKAFQTYIKEHPDSRLATHLKWLLNTEQTQASRLRTGQQLPSLVLPPENLSPDAADSLHLKPGRPLLIVFWASWCRNSQDAFFNIRRYMRQSAEADTLHRLRTIGISLDTEAEKYRNVCRYDSVIWENRCYRQSWSSPVVTDLAVKELPFYILTDPQLKVKALGTDFKTDIQPELEKIITP